jgi:hypothetical protein
MRKGTQMKPTTHYDPEQAEQDGAELDKCLLDEPLDPNEFQQTEALEAVPNYPLPIIDCFSVSTPHIDCHYFKKIELPKITFRSSSSVFERSSILAELFDYDDCCKQVLSAAKNGLESFQLEFRREGDDMDIVRSLWTFHGARIKGVDYDAISRVPRQEQRSIRCEISYDHLDIDGVTL